jgi:hypothetical protein
MRQSLAEIEDAFVEQIDSERSRRQRLLRSAEQRTLQRQAKRRHRRGSVRFVLLVLTLIGTAVGVTVVMFRTLYILLG